jgi:hypothetical protein
MAKELSDGSRSFSPRILGNSVTQVNSPSYKSSDKSFDKARLENEIKVLAVLFNSPNIIGRTLRLLARYAQDHRGPCHAEDLSLLLLISVARERARQEQPQ